MRELRTYGSVGALGGKPPRATRKIESRFRIDNLSAQIIPPSPPCRSPLLRRAVRNDWSPYWLKSSYAQTIFTCFVVSCHLPCKDISPF
jgi:hypothetical protein